jgi:hypothetical protein
MAMGTRTIHCHGPIREDDNPLSERQSLLLQQLESTRRSYGPGAAGSCESLLERLRGLQFATVSDLITVHDALLFLRAFPQSPKVAELADALLAALEPQAAKFAAVEENADIFDDESVSGIAGTTVSNTLTYDLAKQLAARHRNALTASWNVDDHYRQMGLTLPEVVPLLADDAYVEADTPYLKWIESAAGGKKAELSWLLKSLEALKVAPLTRTALFSGLGVQIEWDLRRSPASRTLARRPVRKLFWHTEPLLQRKQVSLEAELAGPRLAIKKLSRSEGRHILDMVQDALTVRYRELQGTTYSDDKTVLHTDCGRGLQLYLWGLQAEWRLPLRAYYAGIAFKNGVPINYFEAIGLFEWMEVGFNTFYTYREGETAWIYAQYLKLLHQVAGTTCVSVYPYQIGQDNEEAIKSGAFWFYRKLGFRPGKRELLALTESEERKLARDPRHRTSAATLRKLASEHIFFEFGDASNGRWDSFSTRTTGLRVQRAMAGKFGSDTQKMRHATSRWLAKLLVVDLSLWSVRERQAFSDFALVLSLAPEVSRWNSTEKIALTAIIRAKAGPDETKYLRLMQRHDALRELFLTVGSVGGAPL